MIFPEILLESQDFFVSLPLEHWRLPRWRCRCDFRWLTIASAIISRIAKSVGNCLEIKYRKEIISG